MNQPLTSSTILTPDLLLQAFDVPITFHRCLVPITGSVTAALMLSHAIWTSQDIGDTADAWFCKSQEQWEEETGLTRWEQEYARRALRKGGLLEESRIGMPAKLWFRVCASGICEALRVYAAHAPGLRASAWREGHGR